MCILTNCNKNKNNRNKTIAIGITVDKIQQHPSENHILYLLLYLKHRCFALVIVYDMLGMIDLLNGMFRDIGCRFCVFRCMSRLVFVIGCCTRSRNSGIIISAFKLYL